MDTPTIAKYYREKDPMERLKLLEQSIAAGEEPEENRIRKELWEIRYSDKAETGDTRADGYLGLWMTMEFNRNSASRFFGTRSAKKEIGKYLKKLKFQEFQEKGGLYEELFKLSDVLGLKIEKKEEILDKEIEDLIQERQAARKAKDFKRADEIRDELLKKGIILKDTREGVKWQRA